MPVKRDCFYHRIKTGQRFTAEYQVIEGGNHDISFNAQDTEGQDLVADYQEQRNRHDLHAAAEGVYSFCFDNTFSQFSAKKVFFQLIIEEAEERLDFEREKTGSEDETDESVFGISQKNFKKITEDIRKNLEKSIQIQSDIKIGEARDRSQQEENFEVVNFWSSIHLFVVVSVSLTTLLLIRGLFLDKKTAVFHVGFRQTNLKVREQYGKVHVEIGPTNGIMTENTWYECQIFESGGSATCGEDYKLEEESKFRITSTNPIAVYGVTILDDKEHEVDELISLHLKCYEKGEGGGHGTKGAFMVSPCTTKISIVDNDHEDHDTDSTTHIIQSIGLGSLQRKVCYEIAAVPWDIVEIYHDSRTAFSVSITVSDKKCVSELNLKTPFSNTTVTGSKVRLNDEEVVANWIGTEEYAYLTEASIGFQFTIVGATLFIRQTTPIRTILAEAVRSEDGLCLDVRLRNIETDGLFDPFISGVFGHVARSRMEFITDKVVRINDKTSDTHKHGDCWSIGYHDLIFPYKTVDFRGRSD
ncbi:DgyrCDS9517 [Dimorphilus gyrociliatus]|uniref:DgyrCDS9517 n=1 Tax=Dimorphilus gyrociliatus TaxID=2664684 RepID=A0A7I8VXL1_9ANNE|nr:DgyrCDS9517 [Dimorphilus gyrociliatus]